MPETPFPSSRFTRRNRRLSGQRFAAFRTGLLVIGIMVLWILFLPLQFGGAVSYVMVDGVSMTPVYKTGDLVIVRKASKYKIGDIVTYEYPDLGRVIHRIIGRDGLQYIIKGDANDWIDSYHPGAEEILGKEWIHLPGVGKVLKTLRSPGWIAGLVFFGVLMFAFADDKESGRRKKGQLRARASRAALGFGKWLGGMQELYYGVAFTLGLGALVLGIFAFTRPILVTEPIELSYEQFGLYAYVGDAPAGVYDQSRLKSGDAVFPQVTCNVHVMFNYHLIHSGQADITGSHHLIATVSDGKGWNRTVELQPLTQINTGAFQSEGDINFCDIRAMIEEVQDITGAVSQTYLVSLKPNVDILGAIDGLLLQDTFSPELVFQLEPNQITLVTQFGQEPSSVLQATKSGLLTADQTVKNALSIFNLQLGVDSARWVSIIGLILSVALLAWVMYVNVEAKTKDPLLLAELLSGQPPIIVQPETPMESWSQARVVKIARLEDLARLANSIGALVELVETPEHLYFMVNDQGTRYQTVIEQPMQIEAVAEVEPDGPEPEEDAEK